MHTANTLKTAVACALLGAFCVTAPGAHAQPQFDAKLAKFMADKAAGKLGDLRQGFEMTQAPALAEGASTADRSIEDTLKVDGMELLTPLDTTTTGAIDPSRYLLPHTDIRIVYAG